jgi:hypothetical protein
MATPFGVTSATDPKKKFIEGLAKDQVVGLNAAATRQQAGTSNEDDDRNLKFATDRGFIPNQPTVPQGQPVQTASQPASQPALQNEVQAPSSTAGVDNAFQAYIASLAPSPGVQGARREFTDFVASAKLGESALEGQGRGIVRSLVRGKQAKLREQSEIEAERLRGTIGIEERAAEGIQEQAEARLQFQQGVLERERQEEEARKPVIQNVGGTLVRTDPTTGETTTLFTPPKKNELDDLLSRTDAQALGLPFGTTKGEAAKLGIIPTASTKAPKGPKAPSTLEQESNIDRADIVPGDKRFSKQLGIQNFTPRFLERLFNSKDLSDDDVSDFVKKFKADQAKVPMSLDPEIFLEVWLENKPKGKTTTAQSNRASNEEIADF